MNPLDGSDDHEYERLRQEFIEEFGRDPDAQELHDFDMCKRTFEKPSEEERRRQAEFLSRLLAGKSLAKTAMNIVMPKVSKEGLSLDDIVDILSRERGALRVIDERPASVIVMFADGTGVGVSSKGLDLLEST